MSKTITEQYRGNIPLGVKYILADVIYKSKDDSFSFSSCENCGHIISNIYTIKNEEGRKYDVGSECVGAIIGHSLELIEAKRILAKSRRFLKILKTIATSITVHFYPDSQEQYFRMYKGSKIRTKWEVNAIGRANFKNYKAIIQKLNIPITYCQE